MKSIILRGLPPPSQSLSARRVWIEIRYETSDPALSQSLSARRVWIEIGDDGAEDHDRGGHSLRGECGLKLVPN